MQSMYTIQPARCRVRINASVPFVNALRVQVDDISSVLNKNNNNNNNESSHLRTAAPILPKKEEPGRLLLLICTVVCVVNAQRQSVLCCWCEPESLSL